MGMGGENVLTVLEGRGNGACQWIDVWECGTEEIMKAPIVFT